MYTLFKGLYDQYTKQDIYYVMIIGLDNAGKTTLLEKIKALYTDLKTLPPDKIAPTVVANIPIEGCKLNFWDLGGQKDLLPIWEKYYSECHGILFVIDSTDKERLIECRKVFVNQDTEGVPILMLANKQDLKESLKLEEIKEEFNKIALKLDAQDSRVLSISAYTGQGVKDAVDWIFIRMLRNKTYRPPAVQ